MQQPNWPMEAMETQRTAFTCYTAPGVTFANEEEMKEHYRSEWHRQNLKRKVAGLAPLTREAFEERQHGRQHADSGHGRCTYWGVALDNSPPQA